MTVPGFLSGAAKHCYIQNGCPLWMGDCPLSQMPLCPFFSLLYGIKRYYAEQECLCKDLQQSAKGYFQGSRSGFTIYKIFDRARRRRRCVEYSQDQNHEPYDQPPVFLRQKDVPYDPQNDGKQKPSENLEQGRQTNDQAACVPDRKSVV